MKKTKYFDFPFKDGLYIINLKRKKYFISNFALEKPYEKIIKNVKEEMEKRNKRVYLLTIKGQITVKNDEKTIKIPVMFKIMFVKHKNIVIIDHFTIRKKNKKIITVY
ncbi:MAG: hypothetical protein NZM44_05110 [Candidatus Calescibacterium sp.]|nr:hypothetical protein [Candidatus Calescibacterium sp.]